MALGEDRKPDLDRAWVYDASHERQLVACVVDSHRPSSKLSTPCSRHSRGRIDRESETVLDRVVSSYSLSIRALRHGREECPGAANQDRASRGATDTKARKSSAVLVAMEMRFAREEVEMLRGLCPSFGLTPIEPERPRNCVLSSIKTCRVFHFAGHGISDPKAPA